MTTTDEGGNPFAPSTCPCCQGKDEYNPHDLCDACVVAAFEGRYPHGCTHNDHCQPHREEYGR